MDGYLGIIVIVAVVALLAVGGLFLFFRPKGKGAPTLEAPPRPQAPAGEQPQAPDLGEQQGAATTTLPPPPAEELVKAPEIEVPPPSAGRMVRLRSRLARSQSALGKGLLELLSRDRLDDEVWDEIEETLITADVGVAPTRAIVEDLRTKVKVLGTRTPTEVRGMLREELLAQIAPELDRTIKTRPTGERPAVVLVVGVNGTGKTTTTGKLARALVGDGNKVVLGAADTFRAAAADQLQTWGDRVGAAVVRGPEGGDPASVAFDAVARGIDDKVDTVIVDTAGRLHTKTGLMDELGKVKRVIEKKAVVDEVLLVLDATTGQNGMRQAQVFAEVVNITGIALTKLDGTAKGGIVISVQRELGVPVKLVGLGEGPDDLAPFDPEVFVDALLGD
ncbi:signal recognition particle-docking protein FtsY [Planotetraspora thailandica]|uniref:signal recognition particle-docking protein FtsY n=1 Tax=Planotetraspora thailandica TaxID=487172 RepID=UPI00194E6A5A|nr:signal recognition particle-docking protein FtsY [Planotetraspora thailandica]